MFATLEQHFAKWEQTVSADIASHVRAFFDHAKAEEAKIAAEVEHLKAIGYQITKDGAQL
jgi:hypothetical protein